MNVPSGACIHACHDTWQSLAYRRILGDLATVGKSGGPVLVVGYLLEMEPERTAYLTIDDAPSEGFLDKLSYLSSRGIPAIFFCTGGDLERRRDYAVAAIRHGYVIGNHSWSHPSFSDLTFEQIRAEIERTDIEIEVAYRLAGTQRQHMLFRFPYGDKGDPGLRDQIQAYLRAEGYTAPPFPDITYESYESYRADADWYWTFDTYDWVLKSASRRREYDLHTPEDALALMDRDEPEAGYGLSSGSSAEIILIHDLINNSLFTDMIEKVQAKGFVFRDPTSA